MGRHHRRPEPEAEPEPEPEPAEGRDVRTGEHVYRIKWEDDAAA